MSKSKVATASTWVDSVEHCSQTHARTSANSPMIEILEESPEGRVWRFREDMVKIWAERI
jgi:hypothetical protein